jgi:hypothetical protein
LFVLKQHFKIFGGVAKKMCAMTPGTKPSTSPILITTLLEAKQCFHSGVKVGKQPPHINSVEILQIWNDYFLI